MKVPQNRRRPIHLLLHNNNYYSISRKAFSLNSMTFLYPRLCGAMRMFLRYFKPSSVNRSPMGPMPMAHLNFKFTFTEILFPSLSCVCVSHGFISISFILKTEWGFNTNYGPVTSSIYRKTANNLYIDASCLISRWNVTTWEFVKFT